MAVDGSLVWDFLVAHFASRRAFLAVFRRYESRVMRFARDAGVHREDLMLPPPQLARLFQQRQLGCRFQFIDLRWCGLLRRSHLTPGGVGIAVQFIDSPVTKSDVRNISWEAINNQPHRCRRAGRAVVVMVPDDGADGRLAARGDGVDVRCRARVGEHQLPQISAGRVFHGDAF